MSKHEQVQLNGVCWDCGKEGAEPVAMLKSRRFVENQEVIDSIGWKCSCGRSWYVTKEDMANWVVEYCHWNGIIRGQITIKVPEICRFCGVELERVAFTIDDKPTCEACMKSAVHGMLDRGGDVKVAVATCASCGKPIESAKYGIMTLEGEPLCLECGMTGECAKCGKMICPSNRTTINMSGQEICHDCYDGPKEENG